MRILRGLTRKDAAPLVGLTYKTIEQVENGRVQLTQDKIDRYCTAYNFSQKQFKIICQGKVGEIKKQLNANKPKVIEKLLPKRCLSPP